MIVEAGEGVAALHSDWNRVSSVWKCSGPIVAAGGRVLGGFTVARHSNNMFYI